MCGRERRAFVRHPIGVPLEWEVVGQEGSAASLARDLSVGGISFPARRPPLPGERLRVRIGLTQPPFEAEGVVVRVEPGEAGSVVGVAFDSQKVWFRVRLVEQLCHIEAWRRDQEGQGRRLDFEEAAHEWIPAHAAYFED